MVVSDGVMSSSNLMVARPPIYQAGVGGDGPGWPSEVGEGRCPRACVRHGGVEVTVGEEQRSARHPPRCSPSMH
jgi:hypothetical protein